MAHLCGVNQCYDVTASHIVANGLKHCHDCTGHLGRQVGDTSGVEDDLTIGRQFIRHRSFFNKANVDPVLFDALDGGKLDAAVVERVSTVVLGSGK